MKKKVTGKIITWVIAAAVMFAFPLTALAGEYQSGIDAMTYDQMEIPAYDGYITEVVNENDPSFTDEEEQTALQEPYENYSDLDDKGRAGVCEASLNKCLMPDYKRGSISAIKPSGWVQAQYDIISGKYLYNRCHLIGFQLTGVDNENIKKEFASRDLITGTRALNVGSGSTGMVEFENLVAQHLKDNPDHNVLYRVTPVYGGDNLVAYGVLMEGQCTSDNDIHFNIFCYNVQPGVDIDYETGRSKLTGYSGSIADADITLNKTKWNYTGKAIKPAVTVVFNGTKLVEDRDYKVSYSSNTRVGQGVVTIKGIGEYYGTEKYNFSIVKSPNPLKVSVKRVSFRRSDLKTKRVLVAKIIRENGKGTVTCTKVSGSVKLSVTKTTGKIYLKKCTKKGTYKIRVKTRAAGNTCYKSKVWYSDYKVTLR